MIGNGPAAIAQAWDRLAAEYVREFGPVERVGSLVERPEARQCQTASPRWSWFLCALSAGQPIP